MVTPQTIEVASLGFENSLILMVLALVVFGPRRLPEIGRQIGKLMYEVRKASNDFKFQMEEELRKAEDAERRAKEAERLAALPPPPQTIEATAPTPVPDGQFPTPNPYPEEAVYPAVSPGEFVHDEPYPLIQPPSTGEPVAAERPNRMMEKGEAPAEAPAKRAVRAARAKEAAGKTAGESAGIAKTPVKRIRKKPESANG